MKKFRKIEKDALRFFIPDLAAEPEIDPIDAVRAMYARVNQKRRDRKSDNPTEQELLDDFIFSALANTPVNKWSMDFWNAILFHTTRTDGNFLIRLGHVLKQGRKRIFDDFDIFFLKNWRRGLTLHNKTPLKAIALLRRTKVTSISKNDQTAVHWYESRRKRLGLIS